jgi:hypothetical protein
MKYLTINFSLSHFSFFSYAPLVSIEGFKFPLQISDITFTQVNGSYERAAKISYTR